MTVHNKLCHWTIPTLALIWRMFMLILLGAILIELENDVIDSLLGDDEDGDVTFAILIFCRKVWEINSPR